MIRGKTHFEQVPLERVKAVTAEAVPKEQKSGRLSKKAEPNGLRPGSVAKKRR
jgi:hypothetical protein